MAMTINPIAATVTQTSTAQVQANLLYVDSLNVDASNRAANPKASAKVTPYALSGATPPVPQYADSTQLVTKDLYAACAALPTVAAAMQAVQVGMTDWQNYVTAAQANLAAKQAKIETLSIAITTAKKALAAAPEATPGPLTAAVTAAIAGTSGRDERSWSIRRPA